MVKIKIDKAGLDKALRLYRKYSIRQDSDAYSDFLNSCDYVLINRAYEWNEASHAIRTVFFFNNNQPTDSDIYAFFEYLGAEIVDEDA